TQQADEKTDEKRGDQAAGGVGRLGVGWSDAGAAESASVCGARTRKGPRAKAAAAAPADRARTATTTQADMARARRRREPLDLTCVNSTYCRLLKASEPTKLGWDKDTLPTVLCPTV